MIKSNNTNHHYHYHNQYFTVTRFVVVVNWLDIGVAIMRSRVRLPAVPLSCNDSGQVVHTHVHLSTSNVIKHELK